MRVRIIANHPDDPKGSSISEYIGKIFDAEQMHGTKNISVCFDIDVGTMTVYPDEYEVVDIVKDLDEFIKRNCEFSITSQEIKQFILANRVGLTKLLNKQ